MSSGQSNIIEIDGHGEFEMSSGFFELSKPEQDAIVQQIVEAQSSRIDIDPISEDDVHTKQDVVVEATSMIPGAYAGAKAGLMLPVPPIVKPVTGIIGAAVGGPAMEEYVEPVVRPVVNALTPPDSWDNSGQTFTDKAKNLAHDFITGQWDDW